MPDNPTILQRLAKSPTLAPNAGTTNPQDNSGVPVIEAWTNFSGGYQVLDSPEDCPDNASFDAPDMEVDLRDRLMRAPGIALLETLARTPRFMLLHGNLDFYSDLLLFDPPYMGIKSDGVTNWVNVGLAGDRSITGVAYADVMLISDGSKVYARHPGETTLEALTEAPPASTFAVFGSRVIAGNALLEGNTQPLGVAWNAASSDYKDWTGEGSGSEFLISGGPESDNIVAMRVMNLEYLSILTRRGVWIGTLTGNLDEPFHFELRVKGGSGCVAEATAHSTDIGVMYLSDDGVRVFDSNTSTLLSQAINSALLPLVNNGVGYKASYDPNTKRYYLYVPSGPTYVLDIQNQRWYLWSRTFNGGVNFPVQAHQTTWAELLGTWADQTSRWADFVGREGSNRHLILRGNLLGVEDISTETSFGDTFYPRWSLPLKLDTMFDRMFRFQQAQVRHDGLGSLRITLPDSKGNYNFNRDFDLTTNGHDTKKVFMDQCGLGFGARLEIRSGFPKISRIMLKADMQGLRQGA